MHDKILYRKTYFVNSHRVPADGTPIVVVSNHQNALNDPLALEFAFRSRIISIFARGDIFAHKFIARFLNSLYILPAYRLRTDGYEQIDKNIESFDEAHRRLLNGETVAIFPEGTNQDRHYLGSFSQGYLRMAFGAAEKCDFDKEIFILPTANHYSNYFHMQADMLVACGNPISLKPYYELYKTKPRTAQREVNRLVHAEVEKLMLNITDTEHYAAIDFLRNSYGRHFAKAIGKNPDILPEKLEADQIFVRRMNDLALSDPDTLCQKYSDALQIDSTARANNIRNWNFDYRFSAVRHALQGALFVLLLPLFVIALIPNIIAFWAPKRVVRKFEAMGSVFKMFTGGIQFALNALFVLPLCYFAVFVADFFIFNWIVAVLHTLTLPWLGLFAWYYRLYFIKWRSTRHFEKIKNNSDIQQATALRRNLWQWLDNKILKQNQQ